MIKMDNINMFKKMIEESSNIVFFGGAGVSTESNIPDFRSEAGLYKTKNNFSYPPEIMLSHSFFMKHTEDFFDFYKTKMIYNDAKPNDAHKALAELERRGKLKAVITQNIDGLHQIAGSKNVLELHGSVLRNYCMKCNKSFDLDYVMNSKGLTPICDECGGIVKPDVVLYEEGLDMNTLNSAVRHIQQADMLIVGGTSLVVYPAAGLIEYFNENKLVLINKASTPYDSQADLVINESIGKVLREATSI
ncbi:NAD-dependent protein deacylase [Clostridium ganghwense]|uniref:NAD-dependent protein deacetylase n=1 Tax=Clostridium ganghwense TaxID=312089 RepID=A0ABT4CMK4_9CLOT|nr:NAD-dependent protein deacylase [Clostridium ganghwense]MCY6370282.1 NAD-dependent protein deacylase [Clostridium ganghwense]